MAKLLKIAQARGEEGANVVFFHGLGGGAYATWQADKNDRATFWPAWLAADIEALSVYSVGYEAPISRWCGSAMHLTDRATNVLGDLLGEPGLANGAIILIGHSFGGLLIKQILRTAQSEAQNDEKAARFLRRVEKIAFLATPHTGADLATWGDRLRILVRPSGATICLVRNDPNLRDLNLWYRDWSNHQKITHLILTETKPSRILGTIVNPDSSDPGLTGHRPRPMDYRHDWICKPLNRVSDIYVAVRSFIESPFERPRDPVAEQVENLAAQQKELAAQVARQKGVEVAPLLAVLVKLGENGVQEEDILNQLNAKADELIKVRAENEILRRGPPALAAIAEEVQSLIDKGDFDAARDALGRARETARTLRIDASRHEAAFLAQEARIDDLQLVYRSSAAKYAEAASLTAPFDTEQQWSFLLSQAGELSKQGEEFGDNSALSEAIDFYHRCLPLVPRSNRPLQWGATQNDLGNALTRLGERESETASLEAAVEAYRDALEERTRERVPLDWAMTQNNLGNALLGLGKRESETARLEAAVEAYRDALKERTRERVPLDWAATQMNLGTALKTLGERESETASLEAAVEAYRAALEEYTRERVPLDWAATQNNLGTALQALGRARPAPSACWKPSRPTATRSKNGRVSACRTAGRGRRTTSAQRFGRSGERETGTERLLEAVEAYRDALKEWTRERAPLDWAMAQITSAQRSHTLGERETGTKHLLEAVEAYRDALKERRRERVPLDWAMTQMNLGNALTELGARERGTARLEQAVAVFRAALEERTRERVPLDWAATQKTSATPSARSANARPAPSACSKRSRPTATRSRSGRASACRSTGRRRRRTSATPSARSANERPALSACSKRRDLPRRAQGTDARAGSTRLGDDAEEPRQRPPYPRRRETGTGG